MLPSTMNLAVDQQMTKRHSQQTTEALAEDAGVSADAESDFASALFGDEEPQIRDLSHIRPVVVEGAALIRPSASLIFWRQRL